MTARLAPSLSLVALLVLCVACGKGETAVKPPEIRYGETECSECRMIINDPRFAAGYTYEMAGGRYESLPFDDIGDMLIFADQHPEHAKMAYWVHDFETEEWLRAEYAYYVFSHRLVTPMARGIAALDSGEKAEALATEYDGHVLDWDGLLAKHRAGELAVSLVGETAAGSASSHIHSHSGSDEMTHTEGQAPVKLGETDVTGYHVALFAHRPLHAGYNHLMLRFVNPNGETMTHANVALSALANMPEMRRAAPVEHPDSYAHLDAHFGGAVGFPMPSGPDVGSWELGVIFSDPASGFEGEASFPVEVVPSKLSGSFAAADNQDEVFLMVVSPQDPDVGVQPFEILAVQKASTMEWLAVDDLSLEIIPEMPTMGHSSPNNKNPSPLGGGHYRGQINFPMTGPWIVTGKASRGGHEIGVVVFEYDLR